MIPVALVAFALLDGTFAGFRAAAGRDGRIDKRRYHLRAMALGALTSTVAVVLLAGLTGIVLATAPDPDRVWDELNLMGARLVVSFVAFSALVVLALGVYAVARHEVRTLATVAILGPFTLARPFLVVGATLGATLLATTWRTAVLAWVASATVLAAGALLHWHYHRRR